MPTAACRVRFSHPGRGRRLLLAALAAFLVLPGRAEVPAEQALVLLGRTRPEHPEQSPVRGLMALKSGFLANVRFFGDYSSSPTQDYPPHPQLATREGDERQTAEKYLPFYRNLTRRSIPLDYHSVRKLAQALYFYEDNKTFHEQTMAQEAAKGTTKEAPGGETKAEAKPASAGEPR